MQNTRAAPHHHRPEGDRPAPSGRNSARVLIWLVVVAGCSALAGGAAGWVITRLIRAP